VIYLLLFLASGLGVVLAGTALARQADIIAEESGVGRLWVGSILLAGATSLPELTTDVVAVRLGSPDLAVGDLFGSSMANMLVLALIDLLPRRGRVLRLATFDHALTACLAISLNALAAVLIVTRPGVTVLGLAPGAVLLALIYVAGSRAVYRHAFRDGPARPAAARSSPSTGARVKLRRATLNFIGAAIAIVAAAPAFAWSAKGIAEVTGLGATFVGTWLVGLATSLPELIACVAAVRIGSLDLAVGNLFGSNAFNMSLFFFLDLAQPGTSIFSALDPNHAISALIAVILMSMGLAAIVYRAEQRFAMVEPDSLLILFAYVLGVVLLYWRTAGP
jgi:cation:H+ antiporter